MWLIDTKTFRLVLHHECPIYKYAILSHTWEEDEVSFQDFKDLTSARLKKGFAKIDSTVRVARQQGYEWAWVDTDDAVVDDQLVDYEKYSCCIDKSNSTELFEAINAMYKWYKNSAVCYAFLSDLPSKPGLEVFRQCRWWTRGWTLQELIAPNEVEFYDQHWKYYKCRSDIEEEIQSITGIPSGAYVASMDGFPVAQRMSWASRRTTTRTEDIAYCLFGLFDINMNLIYGEGEKAFVRLQEEICKQTSDATIFAWTMQPSLRTYTKSENSQKYWGLLASHPAEFAGCADVYQSAKTQWNDSEYDASVSGNNFSFDGLRLEIYKGHGLLIGVGWYESASFGDVRLFIPLKKAIGSHARSNPRHLLGALSPKYNGASVTEINEENLMKISIMEGYTESKALLLPRSKSSFSKRLATWDSMEIDELYENALYVKIDQRMEIIAAYPAKFWVPDEMAFLMDQELTGAIIIKSNHAVPNLKPEMLLLIFDCERSDDDKSWKYLKYMVLGSKVRHKQLGQEEREFRELVEQIEQEKMITYEVYQSVVDTMLRRNQGRLGGDAQMKFEASTWRTGEGRYEIQAEVDSKQCTAGKTVLELRVNDRFQKAWIRARI